MGNTPAVTSGGLGRPPSKNPKGIHLGLRIDHDTAQAIDGEIERLKKAHPGLSLTRSDVVRMLIVEALSGRKRSK